MTCLIIRLIPEFEIYLVNFDALKKRAAFVIRTLTIDNLSISNRKRSNGFDFK